MELTEEQILNRKKVVYDLRQPDNQALKCRGAMFQWNGFSQQQRCALGQIAISLGLEKHAKAGGLLEPMAQALGLPLSAFGGSVGSEHPMAQIIKWNDGESRSWDYIADKIEEGWDHGIS